MGIKCLFFLAILMMENKLNKEKRYILLRFKDKRKSTYSIKCCQSYSPKLKIYDTCYKYFCTNCTFI